MITSPQNFSQFGNDCFGNRYDYFNQATSSNHEDNFEIRDEKAQNNMYKRAIENMAKDIVPQPVKEEKPRKGKPIKRRAVSPVLVRMRKELNVEESLNYITNSYNARASQDQNSIGYNPNTKKDRYNHISLRQSTSRNLKPNPNESNQNNQQFFESLNLQGLQGLQSSQFHQRLPEIKSPMFPRNQSQLQFQYQNNNLNFNSNLNSNLNLNLGISLNNPSIIQFDNANLYQNQNQNGLSNNLNFNGQELSSTINKEKKEYFNQLQQVTIMTPASNLSTNMNSINPVFENLQNVYQNQYVQEQSFNFGTQIVDNSIQNNQFNINNINNINTLKNIVPPINFSGIPGQQNSFNLLNQFSQFQQCNIGSQLVSFNLINQNQQQNISTQPINLNNQFNQANSVNIFNPKNQNNIGSQVIPINQSVQISQLNLNPQNNPVIQTNQVNQVNQADLSNFYNQSIGQVQNANNLTTPQINQYFYYLPASQNVTNGSSNINNPSTTTSNNNYIYSNLVNNPNEGYNQQLKDSSTNLTSFSGIFPLSQPNLSPMNIKLLKTYNGIGNNNNIQTIKQPNISQFQVNQTRESVVTKSIPSLFTFAKNGKTLNQNPNPIQNQKASDLKNDKALKTPVRF